MVVHTCNLSFKIVEAVGLWVCDQPEAHSKFQTIGRDLVLKNIAVIVCDYLFMYPSVFASIHSSFNSILSVMYLLLFCNTNRYLEKLEAI